MTFIVQAIIHKEGKNSIEDPANLRNYIQKDQDKRSIRAIPTIFTTSFNFFSEMGPNEDKENNRKNLYLSAELVDPLSFFQYLSSAGFAVKDSRLRRKIK